MEQVLKYLNDFYPLTPQLQDLVLDHLEPIKMPRKDFFLREEEINTHIYFLLTGLVRIYHVTLDGKQVTTWLLPEGNLFISVYSFFRQAPSFEVIEALEDCEAVGFSLKTLDKICEIDPDFNKYQIAILRTYYAVSEERKFRLAQQKPLDRYKNLVSNESDLLQRVPLKIIASYLNMSESTLKRARSDFKKENSVKKRLI